MCHGVGRRWEDLGGEQNTREVRKESEEWIIVLSHQQQEHSRSAGEMSEQWYRAVTSAAISTRTGDSQLSPKNKTPKCGVEGSP